MDAHVPILSTSSLGRFMRRALDAQGVWAAAGEEGLARVASPTRIGRMVTLLWSDRAEAERHGSEAAVHARIKLLALPDLLIEVLPKLEALERLVGPDWGGAPRVEPEIEPGELAARLRAEAVAQFVRNATRRERVWVLQGAEGPVCLMSKGRPGAQVLPCWYEAAHAEARIAGPLADALAAPVSVAAFRERTLPWLADSGRLVAPGYCEGPGVVELVPADLEARLAAAVSRGAPPI